MKKKRMDVSIIIVNYNTCGLTRNCLKSIFEQTKDLDFEVIVSDNGSTDGSIEMIKAEYPQVVLIENNANLGFGAANNRGLKIAKGKYIFYLNSDTVLLNNAVKFLYDYWENSQEESTIGALGGNLLDKEEKITYSYGNFPKPAKEVILFIKRILVTYVKLILNCFNRQHTKNRATQIYTVKNGKVESVSGADLFVKNNELAFFDERFFLYYEETNLQWKMMQKGLDRIIISGPKIVHLCGGSDSKKKKNGNAVDYVSFSSIHSDLSRIKFVKYNQSRFYALILKILLYCFWLTPKFNEKVKKYRKEIWKI